MNRVGTGNPAVIVKKLLTDGFRMRIYAVNWMAKEVLQGKDDTAAQEQ